MWTQLLGMGWMLFSFMGEDGALVLKRDAILVNLSPATPPLVPDDSFGGSMREKKKRWLMGKTNRRFARKGGLVLACALALGSFGAMAQVISVDQIRDNGAWVQGRGDERVALDADIIFDRGSAQVRPDGRGELDRLARWLRDGEFRSERISAHTDSNDRDGRCDDGGRRW